MENTMQRFAMILVLLGFTSIGVMAQVPRMALVEHFTQASCGPCASQNPALQSLLDANPGVTSIKYQVSWPGSDPMNAHNPGHVTQRVNFYTVNSVPQTVFDGNVYKGSPSGLTQSMINNRANVTSPFSMSAQYHLNDAKDSIFVTVTYKKEADTSNTAVYLRVAVLEKHITFFSAPGSNGERDFYHVMKRMLPNSFGTAVPSGMATGDTETVQLSWKLANVYDVNELMVVAFIQNHDNKTVYQSTASESPITSLSQGIASSELKWTLYPNPAQHEIHMSLPAWSAGDAVLEVFDVQGALQYRRSMSETDVRNHTLSLQNWIPGMYISRLTSGHQVLTQRFSVLAQ
jgi:hypothetical protein